MKIDAFYNLVQVLTNKYDINNDIEVIRLIKKCIDVTDNNSSEASLLYDLIGINRQQIIATSRIATVDVIEDLKILEHFPFKMNELYKNPFPNSNSIIKFLIKNSVTPERNLNMFISGRPGTGKTTYVRYLSKKSGLPIYQVKASNLVSSFIGDTQRNIDLLLKDINKVGSKGIVLIDELDSIFGNRKSTINDEYKRIIGSFNLMLDSLGLGTVMIAITNHSEYIDEAIIRRFNVKIELNKVEIDDFVKALVDNCQYNGIEIDENLVVKIINSYTNGVEDTLTYSMINSVVDEYFFMNENIYMKLIKNLYHIDEVKVDESFLSELNFNYSEIAKILQKDRRTIKSRIDKER